ncbi:MAG: hypothetical protein ACRETB_09785 [Steroidobacteraceae bacterium]
MDKKKSGVMAGLAALLVGSVAAGAFSAAATHDSPTPSRTREARTMARAAHTLHYTLLYADAHGVSHFKTETLHLHPSAGAAATASSGAGAASVKPSLSAPEALISYPLSQGGGATLLLLKRGAVEDWHLAPRRMWLIVVQGEAEVTASDGEVRHFGLGSVLLMDDLSGKGHITRAVGNVDHIALTIPAPAQ